MRRLVVFTGFVLLSMALPAAALAQSAGEGYSGVAGADDGGSLPFTGLELGVVLAAGLVLLAMGLVLRRRARIN